ncbi:MAG TPA: sensor histidine kinase, partial [Arenimonas sp.]|nr:sensor histidine kinase [Arenimonas sp.]
MPAARTPWLPDFCRLPRLAAVLGVAQLVVLVLLLAPSRGGVWRLEEFIAASAFAHWVALTAAVLLCKLRSVLLRLPQPPGIALAVVLPAGVALFGAWALQQIDLGLGTGLTLPPDQARQFVFGSAALAALIGAVTLR